MGIREEDELDDKPRKDHRKKVTGAQSHVDDESRTDDDLETQGDTTIPLMDDKPVTDRTFSDRYPKGTNSQGIHRK